MQGLPASTCTDATPVGKGPQEGRTGQALLCPQLQGCTAGASSRCRSPKGTESTRTSRASSRLPWVWADHGASGRGAGPGGLLRAHLVLVVGTCDVLLGQTQAGTPPWQEGRRVKTRRSCAPTAPSGVCLPSELRTRVRVSACTTHSAHSHSSLLSLGSDRCLGGVLSGPPPHGKRCVKEAFGPGGWQGRGQDSQLLSRTQSCHAAGPRISMYYTHQYMDPSAPARGQEGPEEGSQGRNVLTPFCTCQLKRGHEARAPGGRRAG